MSIYAHLSLTAVLEAALKSLNNPYETFPSERWAWNKTSFCATESYLSGYHHNEQAIQDIKYCCNLATDLEAISLLLVYILLTRQAHQPLGQHPSISKS